MDDVSGYHNNFIMAKMHSITIVFSVLFSVILGITYSLETLSHLAGVLGLASIIITAFLAYRKQLLRSGFTSFQDTYRTEMADFKKTVRDYIAINDQRNHENIERIVELYSETRDLIKDQNKVCDIVQSTKPIIEKNEKEWRDRMEKEITELAEKISHINAVVNNKENSN